MYTKQAEFKAGLVVICGIVALLALVYFAGGSEPFWAAYRYVHVRFAQGFTAPHVGDSANMNGVVVGRVSRVQQREEIRGEGSSIPLTAADRRRLGITPEQKGTVREVYVLAVIKMPADQQLPRGTTAQVGKTLTGIRFLDLLPGAATENLTDEMTRRKPIPGREAPGIGDIAGQVEELVARLKGLVGSGAEVMAEAKALLATLREKIAAFNTAELDADARAAVKALRNTMENLEKKIERVASNLETASASVKDITERGSALMDVVSADARDVLTGVKRVVAHIEEIVKDARGPAKEILANIRLASRNVASATEGLAGLGPQSRALLADLGVDLSTLLKNLNDTAHNLLDASEDLRTHPWKLLNEPEEKQIAFANLRNASQSYVRAMREVNEASQRLFSLLQRPRADEPELRAVIERAIEAFQASLEGYQRAEQRWQRLFRETKPGR